MCMRIMVFQYDCLLLLEFLKKGYHTSGFSVRGRKKSRLLSCFNKLSIFGSDSHSHKQYTLAATVTSKPIDV